MTRLSARLLSTGIVLLAAAAGQAQADWTYFSTTDIPNNGLYSSGTGTITVTVPPTTTGVVGTNTPLLSVETSSTATQPPGDAYNNTFHLDIKITDASNQTGDINFTGTLAGSLTGSPSGPTVLASLTSANPSVTFDGHTYTVSIPPVTLVANGPAQNINGIFTVSDATGPPNGGNSQGTPEPASLVLSSLGFSFVGVGCWWKRRGKVDAV
jgi:hypothetical protein